MALSIRGYSIWIAGPAQHLDSTVALALDMGIEGELAPRVYERAGSASCLLGGGGNEEEAPSSHSLSLAIYGRQKNWCQNHESGRTGHVPQWLHHLRKWDLHLTWAQGRTGPSSRSCW